MSDSADSLPSHFDFANRESSIFENWMKKGYFHSEPDSQREPFTIVIPPPNVTGALHLGHALNNTLQDVMIRMKRMQGFNTLWMPGTDHAGIATQARVEARIKKEEGKTRNDFEREELVGRIWEWKNQYEKRILGQLQKMGCSCDWDRVRFTLDEMCARAVRDTFYDLFTKQWIYRGKRLVNWDCKLQTAVSDDEVYNQKTQGHFWHLKYPVIDPKPGEPEFVHVATTRPETMLGDTAVAVHPEPAKALEKYIGELKEKRDKANESDRPSIETQIESAEERRTQMLPQLELLAQMAADGRKVRLPLMDREIPLVADTWAKPELGSGCVKITPAHDPNDYMVGERCNLELLNVMTPDGKLNAETGPYEGLTIKQGRKKVAADLDELGLLEKVEDREIELPISDRSKEPIEPMLADQWFVKMDQLAQTAMDAVTDDKVSIFPERYRKGYLDWLGEKRDWPVSRQLWWGHQIPVWSVACQGETERDATLQKVRSLPAFAEDRVAIQIEPCSEKNEEKRIALGLPLVTVHVCVKDEGDEIEAQLVGAGLTREEDVLDTWFSSALWPHSTLGWPDQTDELKYYYPTSVLITSRDIITLWVARMVLTGINNVGEIPFDRVFIHPKILDSYGETMSKSKGNGIDPLDVIDKFGADALRFSMAYLTTETQDVRMPVQFECPHCGKTIDQTKKNRELPRVSCPHCSGEFSTQWAEKPEDTAFPRGPVLSERFEESRNFCNKLWNASRFAMMNLDGYTSAPLDSGDMTVEDRWILSRLATVSKNISEALEHFKYAAAMRELKEFAWDEFCSFYIEMLKNRFANPAQRPHAQRMLANTLDCLLKLLHPAMPFITEEIWTLLAQFAPERGLETVETASESIMVAPWPNLDESWQSDEIEQQFSRFQAVLGKLREIRSKQNLPPKQEIRFSLRCDATLQSQLEPMKGYFGSMANAELTGIGEDVEAPKIKATEALADMEIFVDLDGLIDKEAECKRLMKQKEKLEKSIQSKIGRLSNEKFVNNAKPEFVQEVRDSLEQEKIQLEKIEDSLNELGCTV